MEVVVTLIKVLIIALVYLVMGPGIGFFVNGRETARRIVLGFLAWWLVRPPSDFTLMLYSIEKYRGHTKGFEFNFLEAIAMGLALAALLEKRKDFKFLPPGLWSWLLVVLVGLLSVPGAINPLYGLMPAFKFVKMAFIYVGVFAALHDDRDVLAMMRGFAVALIVQLIVCLWSRYVMGGFRVIGWFEHQNPMAMWSYMVGLPILALAMSKQTSGRDVLLFFAAFASAGLVVVLTVSRAALAAFALGTMMVMAAAYLQGLSSRKIAVGVVMAIGGALAMAMAADTFMERMETAGDDKPENDLRWALNRQSGAMYQDHPLVGIGWNNFGLANSRPNGTKYSHILEKWEEHRGHKIYPEMFRANPLTESFFWLILAENGSLGFISILLFMVITLWYGLRSTIGFWKTPLGLFFFGVTVALLITYVHCQVERVLTQTKNLTTWMIFCATLSRGIWWRRQAKKIAKAAR
ncbi:O-antigen ligase family protein [Luteolibacter pohnpeiensis]|uniref:O-antigen ligase family protein n=1 Tax=Luteolibacter pohnpeiensis TaxID=454153 RepID=A0A934S513_9BACT|nr:O-antigen ligase family protein [Luteolibacter pohnpeiensis]MBK1882392.1 O-antigen ligase family protein [Luteolibacter pohnpeiensis]